MECNDFIDNDQGEYQEFIEQNNNVIQWFFYDSKSFN